MGDRNVFAKNKQISDAILGSRKLRPIMEAYLTIVCQRLIDLHVDLNIADELIPHASHLAQGGRVPREFILRIPSEGNFREKICFINDIAVGNQKFLWKLLAAPEISAHHNINNTILNKRLQRIHKLTGISNVKSLESFHSAQPDALLNLLNDGPVMLSRYPLLHSVRTARKEEDSWRYGMYNHSANPALSAAEFAYMQDQFPGNLPATKEQDFLLPWQTGVMRWEIDTKSFYARLARHYHQLMIAGPSGSSEMWLEVFELFNDFDVFVATMCCAGWLCNRNDHSLWEVLLAAIPFGLKYSTEDDAYDVVNGWLLN